jgi:hypothetical protein
MDGAIAAAAGGRGHLLRAGAVENALQDVLEVALAPRSLAIPLRVKDRRNKENKKRMRIMEELRLPELQARFHDIVGEATRSPNKKFLLRRIAEALEAQEQEAAEPAPEASQMEPTEADATTGSGEPKLTKLAVDELQQLYTEVVGRDTGSSDRRYLIWKIREAKKGRIKTGPVRRRYADGEAPDMKVLPLRMEAEIVARLDEARERLGLKTRMDLFRKSLADYLTAAGEHEVAQLFTEQA